MSRRGSYWAMAAILFVIMAGATIPAPLFVIYGDDYQFGDDVVTLIFGTQAVFTLGTLMFGRVSDRHGRRLVLTVALVLAVLSSVTFLLAQNVDALFGARALSGVAIGLGQGTAAAALVELQPNADIARASVVTMLATTVGLGAGALVAGVMAEYLPHPTILPFLLYIAALLSCLALLRIVPETVRPSVGRGVRVHIVAIPSVERWTFVAAGCVAFVGFAMQSLFTALSASLLADTLDEQSHALAGAVVFLAFSVGAVAQLVFRAQSTRTLIACGLSCVIVALVLVVVGFARTALVLFLLGAAVGGAGAGMALLGSMIVVNTLSNADRRAEVLSRYNFMAYGGVVLPVLVFGVVNEHADTVVAAIGFSVVLAAVSAAGAGVLLSRPLG